MSLTVFQELTALFLRGSAPVSQRLNALESLPHRWVRTTGLERRELVHAIRTKAGHTPSPLDPIVPAYADCLIGLDAPTYAYIRRQPLAELPWELAHGNKLLPPEPSLADQYPDLLARDRSLIGSLTEAQYRGRLREAFLHKVEVTDPALWARTQLDPRAFGELLWADPCAVPALRLGFVAWHYHVRDQATDARSGDLGDLIRFMEIPYVDVFTTDSARRSLLTALRTSPKYGLSNCGYWKRCAIVPDLAAVVNLLTKAPACSP